MAMAHHPPPEKYERKLFVTEHALSRFRERVSKMNLRTFVALDDRSLGNRLDEVTFEVMNTGRFEKYLDDGQPMALCHLEEVDPDVYAMVKPGRRAGDAPTIVTVLSLSMVTANRADGHWVLCEAEDWKAFGDVKRDMSHLRATTSLGDKLKGIAKEDLPVSAKKTAPAKGSTPPTAPALVDDTLLITYYASSGGLAAVEYERAAALEMFGQLTAEGKKPRIWKPVKAKARTVVDIEE